MQTNQMGLKELLEELLEELQRWWNVQRASTSIRIFKGITERRREIQVIQ